jgi:hypothetical protein
LPDNARHHVLHGATPLVTLVSIVNLHLQPPITVRRPAFIPVTLIPPVRAVLALGTGRGITSGTWIAAHAVTIRVSLTSPIHGQSVAAQIELAPLTRSFRGTVTASSRFLRTGPERLSMASVSVGGLGNRTWYKWRVRSVSGDGQISAWSQGGTFAVSTVPPPRPTLTSASVPLGAWSSVANPAFTWTAGTAGAPLTGYAYATLTNHQLQRHIAPVWRRVTRPTLSLHRWPAGQWHLYVRAVDAVGTWSKPAQWVFYLAHTPPATPRLAAASLRNGAVSNTRVVSLRLAPQTSQAPVREYEYAFAAAGTQVEPKNWTLLSGRTLKLQDLANGSYHVWVRAVDEAGQVSSPLRWSFTLDHTVPHLGHVQVSAQSFTAGVQKIDLHFKLSKPSRVIYDVVPAGATKPILVVHAGAHAAGATTITWNGRLASGHIAPAGQYALIVTATDKVGNTSTIHGGAFTLLTKRILISIKNEAIWAYDGDTLLWYSLVTNGGPDTPTIPGIYHVEWKVLGMIFHSPWPRSSPLWYPDSKTSFALLYNADGGYYLHDAPWRSNYGPGSNSLAGTPGGSYTGTHGCTNVPYYVMQDIYDWADVGTLIQIVS